jgi:acetyl esterase/lipase
MRNPCLFILIALTMMAAACSVMTTPPPTPTPAYLAKLGAIERDVTYCVSDGIALTLDVYYPQAMPKPAPVVVYVHGGSWSAGDKKDSMGMSDVPELLSRGYLVVSVDYRHAPQWKFPTQIEDVKCAIRFLRANAKQLNLDPKRIGAWGHSAGGHLVSLLGTTDVGAGFEGPGNYLDQSSRVQAVADLCGRANLRGMPEDKALSVFGVTSNSVRLLEHASPITFVTQDDPPFLIFHGEKDTVVPLKVSQEFSDRLQAAGVPARLVVVKNADHTFQPVDGMTSPTRAEMTRLIADFFDQYLK